MVGTYKQWKEENLSFLKGEYKEYKESCKIDGSEYLTFAKWSKDRYEWLKEYA